MASDQSAAHPRGRCATFYSYKGGVGRTLAVAGVAADLALGHGKRVLAIDWDLDTPSLHLALGLEDHALRGQPGLVDYIFRSEAEFRYLQHHQLNEGQQGEVRLQDFVMGIGMCEAGVARRGTLDLLPAGNLSTEYLQRLQDLDWRNLYAHHGGFWIMERLRLQASQLYDYILIDARAGRSDVSLIPLLHFSDLAFLVFAANEASVLGIAAIAPALAAHHRVGRSPLAAVLIPSLARTLPPDGVLDRTVGVMANHLADHKVELLGAGDAGPAIVLPYDDHVALTGAYPPGGYPEPWSPLRAAYSRMADVIVHDVR